MSLPAFRAGRLPRRVATISVHTSPLDQPGSGDAGGLNVYVVELSKRLAAVGIEVDVFTRATGGDQPPVVELSPGVRVRHITAGPFEGLTKTDLPAQLCAFTAGVLRVEARHDPGHYELVHSHYWLSGQVGWVAKERWGVPLVHSMHTMARVKNAALAAGDTPEPTARVIGEAQVVDVADRLLASTSDEAAQLVELCGADPAKVLTVPPGVDLELFRPGEQAAARDRCGLPADALVLLFVGRLQPLKAPDLALHAAARLVGDEPALRDRLLVLVVGGPSGTAQHQPELADLARALGIADLVRFEPPTAQRRLVDLYRAATVCLVPSYSESFGLVALEAQACGTPVVAAAVGGLRTAVADGVSGVLVDGHGPAGYAAVLRELLTHPGRRRALADGAVRHAAGFGWSVTAAGVLAAYGGVLGRPARYAVAAAR